MCCSCSISLNCIALSQNSLALHALLLKLYLSTMIDGTGSKCEFKISIISSNVFVDGADNDSKFRSNAYVAVLTMVRKNTLQRLVSSIPRKTALSVQYIDSRIHLMCKIPSSV